MGGLILTLVDNLDKRKVSIESFFKLVNVSDATKIEVLKQLDFPNDSVKDITFEFDAAEFSSHMSYI